MLLVDTQVPRRARTLPARLWADVDDADVVVHETGAAAGREARCSARFPDLDVLGFGHSHIPWDTTSDSGLRLLNPGSPTDRRRQPHCTCLTVVADDGRLRDLTLHRLPRPGDRATG